MNDYETKPAQPMSLKQKMAFMEQLVLIPALSIILLRPNVGARIAGSVSSGLCFCLMFGIAAFCKPEHEPVGLVVFAIASVIGWINNRISRWREFRTGQTTHSYYLGDGGNFRFLPGFVERNRLIPRFVQPAYFFGIGMGIVKAVPALGGWLALAGACLFVTESLAHERLRNEQMDVMDGLANSSIHSETVDRFSPPSDTQENIASAGIPTGLGADIAHKIRRRKI